MLSYLTIRTNMPVVVNMLLHLYAVSTWTQKSKSDAEAPRINGHVNGRVHPTERRVQDAEEFELEGLISEDEDTDSPVEKKPKRPVAV